MKRSIRHRTGCGGSGDPGGQPDARGLGSDYPPALPRLLAVQRSLDDRIAFLERENDLYKRTITTLTRLYYGALDRADRLSVMADALAACSMFAECSDMGKTDHELLV